MTAKCKSRSKRFKKKLDEKFQEKFQAAEDVALPLGYKASFDEYDNSAKWRGGFVWLLSLALVGAAVYIFGGIADLGP